MAPPIAGARGADRGFIAGRSGSGKTYLSRTLLSVYGYDRPAPFRGGVVIVDPNDNYEWRGAPVADHPADLDPQPKAPVWLYRPADALRDADGWNAFWRRVYQDRRRLIVYVDELLAMEPLLRAKRLDGGTNYMTAYLTRGRARYKAGLFASQRPVEIPRHVIGQAEYFFVFDLPIEDDRATMAGVIGRETADGRDVRDRRALGRYEFWFRGPDTPLPVRMMVR